MTGLRQRFPVGQGVGEVDAGAFPILPQRHAQLPQQQAQLQMGDHKGRGQDFEAENARQHRLLELRGGQGGGAFLLQGLVNPP